MLSPRISDHTPCVIAIETSIPRTSIFRFENYWVDCLGFKEVVRFYWNLPTNATSLATRISAKFKNLRRGHKIWSKNISNLAKMIQNCQKTILFMDTLEERRPLLRTEFNFRNILKKHLMQLLYYKQIYWQKRCIIRWVKFGNENKSFFMLWPLKGLEGIQ